MQQPWTSWGAAAEVGERKGTLGKEILICSQSSFLAGGQEFGRALVLGSPGSIYQL